MKKRRILYLCLLVLFFAIGLLFSRLLAVWDERASNPEPLTEGQYLEFPQAGLSLTLPADWHFSELTEDETALLCLAAGTDTDNFTLYVTENAQGDDIRDVPETALIRYYMDAGCDRVRTYTFGGRLFVTYRAAVEDVLGNAYWTVYETWDSRCHLVVETQMPSAQVLPVLAALTLN